MYSEFQQSICRVALSRMSGYASMKQRAGSIDGYCQRAFHVKVNGRGPQADPTAGAVLMREGSDDVLWLILVDESLRSVGEPIRRLVRELWIDPATPPCSPRRYETIAVRMNAGVSTLYAWRDRFLLELGSRAYARGLIRLSEEAREGRTASS